MVSEIRINKYLVLCNTGSRREVEELIKKGYVKVNNQVMLDLAYKVKLFEDSVKLHDQIVKPLKKYSYIILNKPRGYVVTRNSTQADNTVYDLLKDIKVLLSPVGRLDKDSEGLLILTNDGDLIQNITHPRSKVEKTYKVRIKGEFNREKLNLLRSGVEIDGYKTKTAKVFVKNQTANSALLRIIITEGKNRQIRKMLEAVSCRIESLRRLQVGSVKLGRLNCGEWRYMTTKEVNDLKNLIAGEG